MFSVERDSHVGENLHRVYNSEAKSDEDSAIKKAVTMAKEQMATDYSSLLNYLHKDQSLRESKNSATNVSTDKDEIEHRLHDIESDLNRIENRLQGHFDSSPQDKRVHMGFRTEEVDNSTED